MSQPVLLGLTHIERSIEIIREFEPEEGFYLAFSGGKDSQVLYELAKRSGVRFDAHYNATGIDPPELVRFTASSTRKSSASSRRRRTGGRAFSTTDFRFAFSVGAADH